MRLLDPVAPPGTRAARWLGVLVPTAPPPDRLLGFYWHFLRQARAAFALLFAAGLLVALLDAAVPAIIGRTVGLLTTVPPDRLWADAGDELLLMAAVLLVARPLAVLLQSAVTQLGINADFTALIRWQSHWHVIRQGLPFFQEDFSGRIANRVMQGGPALRESMVQVVSAVWYILVYGTAALLLLAQSDPLLALPIALWFPLYALLLRYVVPRLRERSRRASEARSLLTGRVVDSYANIQTVKLFAAARAEDASMREVLLALNEAFLRQMRMTTFNSGALAALNAAMLVGTAAMGLALWSAGAIGVGAVATALPMAWQIANISGWVAFNVAGIFENVGVVQEAMGSIAQPPTGADPPGARPLAVTGGAIRFERVRFAYDGARPAGIGRAPAVLDGFDLDIAPGERIGLVGHSGAGKSTAVNLLLGFFRAQDGRILIDGQDVAGVTQETLRAAIGVVTQDTALLHRSIADNIRYGRPEADDAAVERAARQAAAHEFILGLRDWRGREGYAAHVGERGVKLSGGQRQRVAIARVLLKDAPILVLDEATSALDSEVERAIQAQLEALMEGKTVLAIAHRLSTLARMDRLVVLEAGRVAEVGTHAALLRAGGTYARLWAQQSGGMLVPAG